MQLKSYWPLYGGKRGLSFWWRILQVSFVEVTLKDRLQDKLKDDKTGNANDEHSVKAISQSGEIWNKLRSSNGHDSKNVLKSRQEFHQWQ